ncbi:hypothetical protein KDX27_42170 [Burkholderia cenocepacia]|uniref:zonular occludens toxin domain-containing protein n=1 Tax=Burkholderia cenocepacia TaxID=95486 RepID=UPI001B950C34|nr:zonular occludens toxin domain-containing protein [Burkholderia cenocepacia]MBR8030380.1 hypothetical protein [Burkholderia cenocepacia]MBR8174271.1 hypothetical protein [Burkholderia cenocepacia]
MAINAYCGVMGSGKSYEVVSGPLLDAIAAGRRVVTNVDGINEQAVHEYLAAKRGLDVARLGSVAHVRTEDVLQDGFFPVEVESGDGASVKPGFVQAGDLLIIDEAWKLWAVGMKILPEHMAFFRMHRHFVHPETGVSCDVVLMIQSISDLHRSLKPVVELSFVMVKLKSLGRPTNYRVEMYEGPKQNAKTRTGTFLRTYKAEIFPLYKSYAGGAGKEAVVDGRQNILRNPALWSFAGGVVLICAVAAFVAWKFFHPKGANTEPVSASKPAAGASGASAVSAAPAAPNRSESRYSSDWRVAGTVRSGDVRWVVLADGRGALRIESPSNFQNAGMAQAGTVDGQQVTSWSGLRGSGGGLGLGVAK